MLFARTGLFYSPVLMLVTGIITTGCAAPLAAQKESESQTQTLVGAGGVWGDQRVQVINSLISVKDDTACLYVSEYSREQAAKFSKNETTLDDTQKDFLARVQAASYPVTPSPISLSRLDGVLAVKEQLRATRGIFNLIVGSAGIYSGSVYGAIGVMFALSGFTGGLSFAFPYLTGAILSFGLAGQGIRDLARGNQGIRTAHADSTLTTPPTVTNLGVTMAFINAAKELPAASTERCPANLTAEATAPFLKKNSLSDIAQAQDDAKNFTDRVLSRLRENQGCTFTGRLADAQMLYHAVPRSSGTNGRSIDITVSKINEREGIKFSSTTLTATQQFKDSDGHSGAKFISDSELGSLALWISDVSIDGIAKAKIAHRSADGAYLNDASSVEGECSAF